MNLQFWQVLPQYDGGHLHLPLRHLPPFKHGRRHIFLDFFLQSLPAYPFRHLHLPGRTQRPNFPQPPLHTAVMKHEF